ncbi:hypothetical protein JCM11641_000518 [Rhodosporidiobolus odoratus]
MQCPACSPSDSSKLLYCHNCLESRLKEHRARRVHLRNALASVTNKAQHLLTSSETSPESAARGGGKPFGVRDERLLKAEKWTLASRAFAAREAVAKGRLELQADESALQSRRQALALRRANLLTARSLLTSLSPSSAVPSPLPLPSASASLPLSLPALASQLSATATSLAAVQPELDGVRHILTLELVTVFALCPSEPVLADPFSPDPSSSSIYPPSSFSTATRATLPTPFERTYTLAGLPLPPLSQLLTLAAPELEALLSHLVHLTRLLALYEGVVLPYAPLPSCFGPGRAGVRATTGLGEPLSQPRQEGDLQAEAQREAAGRGKVEDCWPLCFRSSSSPKKPSPTASTSGSNSAAAPIDGIDVDGDHPSDEDRRLPSSSSSASVKTLSTPVLTLAVSSRKTTRRARAILTGAVAIAYDLAYIAWAREGREAGSEGRREGEMAGNDWAEADLENLGGLVYRAAGIDEPGAGASAKEGRRREGSTSSSSGPFIDPTTPPSSSTANLGSSPSSPSSSTFPLSFPSVVAHYTSLAFSSSSASMSASLATLTPRRRDKKGSASGESSVYVVDDGDEEDDEWDFV